MRFATSRPTRCRRDPELPLLRVVGHDVHQSAPEADAGDLALEVHALVDHDHARGLGGDKVATLPAQDPVPWRGHSDHGVRNDVSSGASSTLSHLPIHSQR